MSPSIRCPVCGTDIAPCLVPVVREAAFFCPHCRHRLAVVASERLPIFMLSVLLSACLCLLLPVRGMALLITVIVAIAVFYWLGRFLRDSIAVPKLQRVRTEGRPPGRSTQTFPSRTPVPRR
jgi:hypothetical protein